jgi:hypothetical protein
LTLVFPTAFKLTFKAMSILAVEMVSRYFFPLKLISGNTDVAANQVWNPDGDLIGKFFLGTTSANMVFANPGRLVILAETKIFVAKIAANGPAAIQP